jgi:hypothetical protein
VNVIVSGKLERDGFSTKRHSAPGSRPHYARAIGYRAASFLRRSFIDAKQVHVPPSGLSRLETGFERMNPRFVRAPSEGWKTQTPQNCSDDRFFIRVSRRPPQDHAKSASDPW